MAILEGDLASVSVEEILEIFFVSSKPATLYLYSEEKEAMVCCANGGVVWANVRGYGEAFGALLLKAGLIDEKMLAQALFDQQTSKQEKRLGEILLEKELITQEDIIQILKNQVSTATYGLASWKTGSFRVEEGLPSIPVFLNPPLDGTTILIESARRQDESGRLLTAFPDHELVPHLIARDGDTEMTLQSDEWRILTLINGTRCIREILTLSHLPNYDATEVLYNLYKQNVFRLERKQDSQQQNMLILDNDRNSRSLLERVLIRRGISVSSATTVEDAEDQIRAGNIAVAIVDPGKAIDTKNLITQLRNKFKPASISIVVIAERDNIAERLKARMGGADLFISKPINLDVDINRIIDILG